MYGTSIYELFQLTSLSLFPKIISPTIYTFVYILILRKEHILHLKRLIHLSNISPSGIGLKKFGNK
jgi:hypothetical protein